MQKLAAVVLALLWWAAPVPGQDRERVQALCQQVPAIAQQLSAITGLELKHPVPCDFMSKDQVNQFLKKRVKQVASPEEIRAEELTLKKFGLVPADYDLAKNMVDLLTEQAAAFYDYDRKKLFITESKGDEQKDTVLAHELSHALADQYFNLAKYTRQGRKSDDGATARLAVMEGQATWLMTEYEARQNGQTLKGNAALTAAMAQLGDNGAGQFPVFENAPLYERRTLIFPYTQGMLFQNAVLERDGQQGFAEVFRRAPVSSQQILHPEKYFNGVKPTDPDLPEAHLPHGYKSLVGGSLGEMEHQILLEQYCGKDRARDLAPHWRGSNFELRENKQAGRVVLLYAVEWDSEESVRQYFAAYREVLGKKWKKLAVTAESADAVSGMGDDGAFELHRKGTIVTSVEGMEPAIH